MGCRPGRAIQGGLWQPVIHVETKNVCRWNDNSFQGASNSQAFRTDAGGGISPLAEPGTRNCTTLL